MRISFLLVGAVSAWVYVIVLGMISVQVEGLWNGGVFDLMNNLVGIVQPKVPYAFYAAMAVLSALFLFLVSRSSLISQHRSRVSFGVGFSVGAFSVIVLALTFFAQGRLPHIGVEVGWQGWIMKGGTNPAAYVMVLAMLLPLLERNADAESEIGDSDSPTDDIEIDQSQARQELE